MARLVVHAIYPIVARARRHIDLAADNRLDSRLFGGLVEINAAVHIAVVRDCDCLLSQLFDPVHDLADAARTVEQAEFCVHMQMYKCHRISLLLL